MESTEKTPNETPPEGESTTSLAYDIALKSYDWVLKRADVWDGNIDKSLTWGSSINAAVVALIIGKYSQPPFVLKYTYWFWIAIGVFVFAIFIGFFGKLRGEIILLEPKELEKDDWTSLSENEFKENIINFAGKHYEKNKQYIKRKFRFTALITFLFIVDLALFITWIIFQGSSCCAL